MRVPPLAVAGSLLFLTVCLCSAANAAPAHVLQPGHGVLACAPDDTNITLVIEDLTAVGAMHAAGTPGAAGTIGPYDRSSSVPEVRTWTVADFGGMPVLAAAIDSRDRSIYTVTTTLYDEPATAAPYGPGGADGPWVRSGAIVVYRIDPMTGVASVLRDITAELGSNAGGAYLEVDEEHDQLYVVDMDTALIHRLALSDGTILGSYDPFPGAAQETIDGDYPALGERILGVTYNPEEDRVYYSVWENDFIFRNDLGLTPDQLSDEYNSNGAGGTFGTPIANTIRSVSVAANGAFQPATDQNEITLLQITQTGVIGAKEDVSQSDFRVVTNGPAADLEFHPDGQALLIAGLSFDSLVPMGQAHQAALLEYRGSSGAWTRVSGAGPGDTMDPYASSVYNLGMGGNLNARGGVEWGYLRVNADQSLAGDGDFVLATADSILTGGGPVPDAFAANRCSPTDGTTFNIYGIQWMGRYDTATNVQQYACNAVNIDLDRNVDDVPSNPFEAQDKYQYGDIDILRAPATLSLGNRVFLDTGVGGGTWDNGVPDGTEPGVGGVSLQLLDENQMPVDLGAGPVTALTDTGGYYLFDDLPAGRYRVRLAASNFSGSGVLVGFRSSTGSEADINLDQDLRDNGIDTSIPDIEGIVSAVVELALDLEPESEGDLGPAGSGNATDRNSNLTVDFGLIDLSASVLSLGNRVWRDQGGAVDTNDGEHDPGEPGIPGVVVDLLGPSGQLLTSETTDGSGFYLFDGLTPGAYSVRVAGSNFQSGGALQGLVNSTPTENSPDADADRNDNGLVATDPVANGILSGPVTLAAELEPTGEADPSGQAADQNSNLTVDFGFFEPLSLGNRVFRDPNDNGVQDPSESGIASVRLELFAADGVTPVLDAQGAPRFAFTDGSGFYLFDELVPGSYVVHVSASNWQGGGPLSGGLSSTCAETDPNLDADTNDNGLDDPQAATNGLYTNPITLDYGIEPLGEEGSAGFASDANSNLSVDFGIVGAEGLYAIPVVDDLGRLILVLLLLGVGMRRLR